MARRSRNQITKELALKIVKKLKAVELADGGDAHQMFQVSNEDDTKIVAVIGIRHSSNKNKGHDYIPTELGVGPNFAKQMGQCTKSRSEYLEKVDPPEQDASD